MLEKEIGKSSGKLLFQSKWQNGKTKNNETINKLQVFHLEMTVLEDKWSCNSLG